MQKITILYGVPAQGAAAASKVQVDAEVVGEYFAVHRPVRRRGDGYELEDTSHWNVTHIPSGAYVASHVPSKELASAIIGKLMMQPIRWHLVNPFEGMRPEAVGEIRTTIRSLAKAVTVDEAWEIGRHLKAVLDKLQTH